MMSTTDNQLPESVAMYFNVHNGGDIALLKECFAKNPTVSDEHRTHKGHSAIQSWLQEAQRKYECKAEPMSIAQRGDEISVTAKVTGKFPGSPIQLQHIFQLAENKIQSLEIRS